MDKLFKVSEVFGHARLGKYHNPSMLVENESGYPYICASNDNNGISKTMPRVVSRLGTDMKDLTLTPSRIIAWGKQCPKFCYHDEPCVTSQGMYFLDMTDYNEEICLYVCAVLQGTCGTKYNYSNCLIGSRLDKEIISLPVTESPDPDHEYTVDDIDWQYMQDRIAELEQDRIAELDAYLKATGLEDYELTEEDKEVLSLSSEAVSDEGDALETDCRDGKVRFGKFKIGDLFEKPSLKFIPKRAFNKAKDISKIKTDEFDLPLVNAKHGDNGIMYYGRKSEWESVSMGIDIVADGAAAVGDVYVQSQETGILYNAYLIKLIEDIHSDRVLLYFAKCIEKITKEQFSYDKKATWEKVKECEINLPITPDGDIDFDYMERYILAIEKLTIADVVKYRDQELYAAKQAVC